MSMTVKQWMRALASRFTRVRGDDGRVVLGAQQAGPRRTPRRRSTFVSPRSMSRRSLDD